MSELTDVIDCVIELATHLQTNFRQQEGHSRCAGYEQEASSDVGDIIERLGRIRASGQRTASAILSDDGEHEDTCM